jgi:hypothetical protein
LGRLPIEIDFNDIRVHISASAALELVACVINGLTDLKRNLLETTAPKFFADLNAQMIEHPILQICRITDPAVTIGKRNLTTSVKRR